MRSHYNSLLTQFLLVSEVRMPAILVELPGPQITKKKINIVIIGFFFFYWVARRGSSQD